MKNHKRKMIFIILIAAIFSFNGQPTEGSTMVKLENLLNSTGVHVENIEFNGYGIITSKESAVQIAKKIFKVCEPHELYNLSEEKGIVLLSANNVIIKTKRLNNENLYYASFKLSQQMDIKNIINIRNCIFKAFSIYNVKPVYSFLIKGMYSNKMSLDEMKIKANQILQSLGTNYMDGIEDGNIVSFIGFNPLIHEKVKVMEAYSNLNIALRANKDLNNTYIWIGCPIITDEY